MLVIHLIFMFVSENCTMSIIVNSHQIQQVKSAVTVGVTKKLRKADPLSSPSPFSKCA